jgi:hypothetical protein
MAQYQEIKRFVEGGLNTDTDPALLPAGDTPYRLNVCVDEVTGKLVNAKGNTGSSYPFSVVGSETFKTIGQCENKADNTILYFVVCSTGANYLIEYDPLGPTVARNTLVSASSYLGLDWDRPITGANVIGGILYWVDGTSPKKANLTKLKNTVTGTLPKYTTVNAQTFSAGMYVPSDAPIVAYGTNSLINKNNVRNRQFQFCYRWVMEDDEVTATSPVSKIAIPSFSEATGVFDDDLSIDNYLSVTVLEGNELVKEIEIFAREGNSGEWGRVAIFDKEEYDILDSEEGVFEYLFYNDTIPYGSDQNQINSIHDNVPQLADVQEVIDEGIMVYGGVTEGYANVTPDVDVAPVSEQIGFSSGSGSITQSFTLSFGPGMSYVDLDMSLNTLPVAGDVLIFDFDSVDFGTSRVTHYSFSGQYPIPSSVVGSNDDFLTWIGTNISVGALKLTVDLSGDKIRFTWKGDVAFAGTPTLITEGASDSVGKTTGFKCGATHPIGMVYFDKLGRCGGVNIEDDLFVKIPFITEPYETGTATGGGTNILNDSAKSWSYDELIQKFVLFTSGANAGLTRRIGMNDSNFFYFDPVLPTAIVAGVNYTIIGSSVGVRQKIRWSIKHIPPIWAHRWAWVYGGNQTMTKWIQYVLSDYNNGIYTIPAISDGEAVYDDGVATSGSATTLVDSTKSGTWTTNSIQNKYVTILESATDGLVGITRPIASNTSTTITVSVAFPGLVGVGDQYVVHNSPTYSDKYKDFTLVNIAALNNHNYDGESHVYLNSSIDPYVFTKGDRIRFITQGDSGRSSSVPFGTPLGTYYDFEIIGYKDNNAATNILLINKFGWSAAGITDKFLVEIYSPRLGIQDTVYYAMGEEYDVLSPETANRVHAGQLNNQDPVSPAVLTATGILTQGDTYYYKRYFSAELGVTYNSGMVESQNMSDLYPSSSYSKGKSFVVLQNAQSKKYRFFRWSNKYFSDTSVNGLSRFESANRTKQLNEEDGEIVKIQSVGFTLRVLQEHKPSTIYIGRSVIESDGGEGEQYTTSSNVLGTIRPMSAQAGTVFPNSVWTEDNATYFFDIYNGEFCRMAENGITPISSYGMKKWFRDKAHTLLLSGISNVDCISVFDRKHNSLIVTFRDYSNSANNETLVFYEPWNRWITWASFKPEMYARSGDELVSFNGGALWYHDGRGSRSKYYNTQYNCEIMVVSNIDPDKIKTLEAIELATNNNKLGSTVASMWSVPEITTPVTSYYPNGQLTKLYAQNWTPKQGKIYSEVKRDVYTHGTLKLLDLINGRPMQHNYFKIKLVHTNPALVDLEQVTLYLTPSE